MPSSTRWRLNISERNDPNYTGIGTLTMQTVVGGSDVCTGGTAVASSVYDATYAASKAFDSNIVTYWSSSGSSLPQTLEYQFASPVAIAEYTLESHATSVQYLPKSWTFEYWDGSAWQVVDTRTAQTGWAGSTPRSFATASVTTARVSQAVVEVLSLPVPAARTTQAVVEVLGTTVATTAPTGALLTQAVVEVLGAANVPGPVRITQLATEVFLANLVPTRVSQVAVEVFTPYSVSARVSQVVVEYFEARPALTRLSQEVVEVFLTRPPCEDDYPRLPDCPEAGYPLVPDCPPDVYPVLPSEDCMDASTFVTNMALAEIGISKTIDNLLTDASQEAHCARLIFSDVMDTVLRDHPWKFATEYAALTWKAGTVETPVNPDWTYTYNLPSDCVRVRRVCEPAMQRRYTVTPIPFDQRADPLTQLDLLLCSEPGGGQLEMPEDDVPTITIEYTRRLTCPAQVNDAQFREAVVFKLAARLAKALARDSKDADRCLRNYAAALPKAQTQHANDSQPQRPVDEPPDWLTGR